MPIPGPPPGVSVQVLLDDGTGTYPYDVTTYARMAEGIAWNRGRQDELSENQAGQLSVTFDNTDGRFTFGSGTYNIACDQGIRLVVNGVTRWTGRVQSWPVSWPQGGQEFSVVQATATDELPPLTRRTLHSAAVEEILTDTFGVTVGGQQQGALWPLSDDPGSSLVPQAHDLCGADRGFTPAPPLVTEGMTGIPPQFGQALGTPDGANGVTITCGTTAPTVGDGLRPLVNGPQWLRVFPTIHFEITYNLTGAFSTGLINLVRTGDGAFVVQLLANQVFIQRGTLDPGYSVATPGPSNAYVGLHAIVFDSTNSTSRLWFDGVLIDSRSGFTTNYDFLGDFRVGSSFLDASSGLSITLGNLTIGPSIASAARSVAHQTAVLTDLKGETPAARITRLAGYVDVPAGSIDASGNTTCGQAAQAGRTVLDCIQETADADLGNAYVDAVGELTYVAGTTFAGLTDATLDANWFDESTALTVDMQNVVNYATGQATSGFAIQGPVYDLTSIAEHGRYEEDLQWNVDTDAQALSRTWWKVNNYSEPTPRTPTLTVDLLTMDSTTQTLALSLDLNTFLNVTGLPSQTPGGTSSAVLIVGISETVSADQWTVTLNCVQRSLAGAWVLGDTTYGVLNSTTKLYV